MPIDSYVPIMFPFDMLPLSNVLASYIAFEFGSHNLVGQRQIRLLLWRLKM